MLRPRTRPLGAAVLLAAAVALRPDGYLPFMYVTVALPFFALAIAAVADHAWSVFEHLRGAPAEGSAAPPPVRRAGVRHHRTGRRSGPPRVAGGTSGRR